MLRATSAASNVSGMASSDTPRRHHRALRKPTAATATDVAKTPIHNHSRKGAGSEANPSEFMYIHAARAPRAPKATLTGTQSSRHRRLRHPMTTSKTTTAST
ncbi:Uncharacterised protein [Mycobacteroides abscessus subsp. abscessus]|nr:Uncharacterised protein [Mycobacteroides abscessus subsp. abscessus]